MINTKPTVWFPTVRTGTGTDVFTEQLVKGLNQRGIRAEITWLPLRAEYLPWSVSIPQPPEWATITHVNTWLHHRFLPKNLPIIATIHHSIHDPKLKPYKGLLRSLYHQYWIAPNERRVMQKSQQVTAVSNFVADLAKQTLCDVPTKVIYNGVDTELFYPNKKIKNNKKPFRLLYVGSWITRKGVDLLPLIMSKLGNDFVLYYTGGAAAEKDKADMPPNMYDLGKLNQQQVIEEMQKADVFLFPSRNEGFGLVVAEAMSCGLPVITSNIPPLTELITTEKTGFLCNIDDTEDFVEKIRSLKKTPLQNVSDFFYNQQTFSRDKMVENYLQLYENITINRL